ncbi:metabolite traffic protein EboE [Thermodesulfobacteriota bacterium]
MKVRENPPVHLTYCLNVHPGETWEENFGAIKTMTLEIRDRVAPAQAFGLGLRLGHLAADSLASPETLNHFKAFLKKHNLYVFTINGFPYGDFHGSRVKEKAYHPDWRTRERCDYTIRLADILSNLIPEGVSGSISTVPGSYKEWIKSDADQAEMIQNLMICVAHLSDIRAKTSQDLHLGLEPEPDCFLETTNDTVTFFTRELGGQGRRYLAELKGCTEAEAGAMIARHLGVCFDTCHMSLQFENLPESIALLKKHGIRLSKIQISTALRAACQERSLARLADFCDPVYLHQVRACCGADDITSYRDLPGALADKDMPKQVGEELRVHFHVPLYFAGYKELGSTSADLTPDFFRNAIESGGAHFEIETYTFNVLPEVLKKRGIVASVCDEYGWVLNRL